MKILRGAGTGVITVVAACAFAGVPAQSIVAGPLWLGAALGGTLSGIESSPRRERMVYEAEVEVMGRC